MTKDTQWTGAWETGPLIILLGAYIRCYTHREQIGNVCHLQWYIASSRIPLLGNCLNHML